jgi:hypothetical protein
VDYKLPEGWEEATDEEGRSYYYHAASGISQWEAPPIQEESVVGIGGTEGGTADWEAVEDEEGRTYYYNSRTGVSAWDIPSIGTSP